VYFYPHRRVSFPAEGGPKVGSQGNQTRIFAHVSSLQLEIKVVASDSQFGSNESEKIGFSIEGDNS
jgi:hypothetical protein